MLFDPSPANEDILPQASKGSYFFNRIGRYLPVVTGGYRPILLKKSDFQFGGAEAPQPPEDLITTLSGFSALR